MASLDIPLQNRVDFWTFKLLLIWLELFVPSNNMAITVLEVDEDKAAWKERLRFGNSWC
jgi:hypothetical protein